MKRSARMCAVTTISLAALFSGLKKSHAATVSITFEEIPGPDLFTDTSPLSDEYTSFGVHFQAPGGYDRGVVLNDSTWSINAHSGNNFLAFNSHDYGDNHAETITFSTLVTSVSLYATGYFEADTFRMTGYNQDGAPVAVDTLTTLDWHPLSISYAGGIETVVVEQLGPDNMFLYDDLSFEFIPEPATLLLLGLGGLMLRKRRQA